MTKPQSVRAQLLFAVVAILAFVVASTNLLYAQNFQNIPALAFTKPFGGTDPLPQVLAVASTSSNFTFSVTPSTNSGGNWLTTAPTGNECCNTPEGLEVIVTTSPSMAVGTYTGQVVIAQWPNGTPKMTVPVTLTVTASGTAYFDAMPGQLSFSMVPSGNAPPGQVMQIRNGGSGTLNWTLSASTADGGNWLNASSASGTAPSNITISIAPNNLPGNGTIAGTFDGQLLFQTSGDAVTVPISMTVGNAFAQVNPLTFTMPFGGSNPLPQVVAVATAGSGFTFNAQAIGSSGGVNWLTVTPSGGECCNTPEGMQVSVVNAGTLPVGTYQGEVIFTEWPSNNRVMTVPVTLNVEPSTAAFFAGVPGQLAFSMNTSGGNPPGQVMQILNGGTGTLNWTVTATTADGGNWLNTSATSGAAPSTLTISITAANLPGNGILAGNFEGNLLFESSTDSVTVPISVTVGNAFVQLNPLSFTMPFGGSNPLPQMLAVATAGSNFTFNAQAVGTSGGVNWLTVSPSGGECCNTPEGMEVSVVNAGTLPVGTYMGEVIFTEWPSNNRVMTVPVTLNVEPSTAAFFAGVPGELAFSMAAKGKTPPPQSITILDGGSGKLKFTITATTADGGAWLKTSLASGTAPKTVTVSIVPSALPGNGTLTGNFEGNLLFQSGTDSVTIPVSMTVGNAFVQLDPINFVMPFGGANPLPQVLPVTTNGSAFTFNAQAVGTSGGVNWLTVSPTGGECCNTPEAMILSVVNASTLPVGIYAGEVIFTEWPSNNRVMTVPVTLTVESSSKSFFDNIPGLTSFGFAVGGTAASQVVPLDNGGSGTLKWSSTATTSDGGKWLTLTPTKGAAPSVVTVKVNPAKLPGAGKQAGTFVGQQIFKTSSGNVTVPVSVTVGTAFAELSALSFSAKSGTNPTPQNITVTTTGSNFTFNAFSFTGKGGNWLSTTPHGVECCNTPTTITVTVSSSSLPVGNYIGELVFTEWPSNNISMTVPVILAVTP